jgi:hypothetical protein
VLPRLLLLLLCLLLVLLALHDHPGACAGRCTQLRGRARYCRYCRRQAVAGLSLSLPSSCPFGVLLVIEVWG